MPDVDPPERPRALREDGVGGHVAEEETRPHDQAEHDAVAGVDDALRRIYDHALELETERLRAAIGVESYVSYVLISNRDPRPGRTTVVIVREALGF